jgi:thiamine-monophosphate kinase
MRLNTAKSIDMAASEFELIRHYFSHLGKQREWLSVGIGDDAAVITPPAGQQLLISVDTLNVGIHFPAQSSAEDIGYKALAVNLSDIAAMGGDPQWFTLALSLPSADEEWLTLFCQGLGELVERYQLCLVGGDTTRGPLSITIQIAGTIPTGQALTRTGAQVGDDIYVTGTLGDATAGLLVCNDELHATESDSRYFLNKLNRPVPRVAIGVGLRGLANACIDVSDGLAADLGHIVQDSGVGAELLMETLPVSASLRAQGLADGRLQEIILFGGDDYELCFTASPQQHMAIQELSHSCDVPITRIGTVIEEHGLYALEHEQRAPMPAKGFDHFQQE